VNDTVLVEILYCGTQLSEHDLCLVLRYRSAQQDVIQQVAVPSVLHYQVNLRVQKITGQGKNIELPERSTGPHYSVQIYILLSFNREPIFMAKIHVTIFTF
jgi:hypothetical protein